MRRAEQTRGGISSEERGANLRGIRGEESEQTRVGISIEEKGASLRERLEVRRRKPEREIKTCEIYLSKIAYNK